MRISDWSSDVCSSDLQIAIGVGLRARRLAEHVKRVAERRIVAATCASQGFANVAAEHELLAHDLHRDANAGADRRLAKPRGHATQAWRVFATVDQGAGHRQPKRRTIDQE